MILAVGLLGAVVAGTIGYRTVGMFGDGPFASGQYRERDPHTKQWVLVHVSDSSKGRLRRVFTGKQLTSVGIDADRDGRIEADVAVKGGAPAGVGFSLSNDGVIDAWAYRDDAGQLLRVEVSTRQDGSIDRWEHYKNNFLVRVDLDTNRNGKADRWQVYEGGILMETFVDANEDGIPDGPPKG